MHKKIILILIIIFPLTLFAQPTFRVTGQPEKLTEGDENYFMHPVWSPDGTTIAVSGANFKGLWVINRDGASLTKLSEEPSAGFGFEWSADSKEILTTVTKFEGAYRTNAIKLFNVEQKTERDLTDYDKKIPALPRWTTDNSQVYFYTGNNLEFVDTGNKINVNTFKPLYFLKHGNLYTQGSSNNLINSVNVLTDEESINLRLSPDGKKISYEIMGGNLHIINIDGSDRIDLGIGYNARWSPDSDYLVYMVTEDDGHQYLSSEIFITRFDGTEKFQLTKSENHLEMNPCWSPNGNQIVYNEEKEGEIFLISIQR